MERDKAFLFLIIGKGGVGKTLLARAIDGLYREEDQPFVGIDADLSNASYHRFSNRAIPIDVGAPEVTSWIESHVLKHLIDTEGMNMIIDTGAGTERNVRAWLADNDVVSILRARNIDVVIFTVFDTSVDSITPFLENKGGPTCLDRNRWVLSETLLMMGFAHSFMPRFAWLAGV